MASKTVAVHASIAAAVDIVFRHIVPIDLTTIFTGYGPLPAVVDTQDQSGGWDAPGQTRTVHLSDGSTAKEHLIAYDRPNSFEYIVSDFSGSLGHLAKEARGHWGFSQHGEEAPTIVVWKYTFYARSRIAYPVLWFIATFLWRGYMQKALHIAQQQLEANVT
ncbi:MAG: SRPBCC family protein [Deltaproteobacteria bacterium]